MVRFSRPAASLSGRRYRQMDLKTARRSCSPTWSTRSSKPEASPAATGRSRKSNGGKRAARSYELTTAELGSKSSRVAETVPAFVKRHSGPREGLKYMARKGDIVKCRAALGLVEHLQRDLAAKMSGARHPRTAIAHGVVDAGRCATEMRKFVKRVPDSAAPCVAHLHVAEARECP